MTIDEFCAAYPRLYHMATADSLKQIEKHGLLSSQEICRIVEAPGKVKDELLAKRRPELVTLTHATHGSFTLRDQKPMIDSKLERCLEGISLRDWYRLLNERVFMWASRDRVETLLKARAYRKFDQLILTIDSRLLLGQHEADISVSTINSGATFYTPVRRGTFTFVPLKDFKTGKPRKPIVEITVKKGIPEFSKYIVSSEIRRGS